MTSLAYRRAVEADMVLVYHTWIDSSRTTPYAGQGSMARWSSRAREDIDDFFGRRGAEAWVAFHPGADLGRADLFGWVALDREWADNQRRRKIAPLIAYIYVKEASRRLGIARGLLRAAGVGAVLHFAYRTSVVGDLMRAGKLPGARHEHLAIRYPAPPADHNEAQTQPARANGQPTDQSTATERHQFR